MKVKFGLIIAIITVIITTIGVFGPSFAFANDVDNSIDDDSSQKQSFIEIKPSDDNPLLALDELDPSTISLVENYSYEVLEDDEPENVPPIQEPVSKDNTTIEKITIRWLSASTGEENPAGFGRIHHVPSSDEVGNEQFQIDFSLSGQDAYEPGMIELVFPAYIWKNRNDQETGTLSLSIPQDPSTTAEFVWRRIGDNIVVTNNKRLPAASKIMLQGTYKNVSAHDIVDMSLSKKLNVTINVMTPYENTITMESNSIDAQIDTYAKIFNTSKTAYNSSSQEYNIWWEEVPSQIPSELLPPSPNDYVYVRWYVSGTASGNQPFEMTVTDTIADEFDGIMLGVSHCFDGTVKSLDQKTVTARLYSGWNTTAKTAYIWTAYPRASIPEDTDIILTNSQTTSVTGIDDGITTSKDAQDSIPAHSPTTYTFIKYWDDDDDRRGLRPRSVDLIITNNGKTWAKVTLTARNATREGNYWSYSWSDHGRLGNMDVSEWLGEDSSGILDTKYGESEQKLMWQYVLKDVEYDIDTHTWTYKNSYTEGWYKYDLSKLSKSAENQFTDSSMTSNADKQSLNRLLEDEEIDVRYSIRGSLSAALSSVWYNAIPNRFTFEDVEYRFNNLPVSTDDVSIKSVYFSTPTLWKYTTLHEESGFYDREVVRPTPPTTISGLVNNEWRDLAILDNGVLTAIVGSGATISGRTMTVPSGTSRIRTDLVSDAQILDIGYDIIFTIRPTDYIKSIINNAFENSDNIRFSLFNQAQGTITYLGEDTSTELEDGTIVSYEKNQQIIKRDAISNAYLHGRLDKVAADLTKTFVMNYNDVERRRLRFHSNITLTQQSNIYNIPDWKEALEKGDIPNSSSGTFYDLIPYGLDIDASSIRVSSGNITSTDLISNYKGSGRTLLIVKAQLNDNLSYTTKTKYPRYSSYPAQGYANTHILSFDAYCSWDMASNIDINSLYNLAAYEADEPIIGTFDQWQGEPDDPLYGNNVLSPSAVGTDSALMTDLDPLRDDPSFVYAGVRLSRGIIDMFAITGLEKTVSVLGSGNWTDGRFDDYVTVEESGTYVYRMYLASETDTYTSDIIVLDDIEDYIPSQEDPDYNDTQWKGKLQSIDVSQIEGLGADPIIYYSTSNEVELGRNTMNPGDDDDVVYNHLQTDTDSSGKKMWTTTEPADLSTVTAIAIDVRHTKQGDDFVLRPGESLFVYMYMNAPYDEDENPAYFNDTDGRDHLLNAHAYNNIHLDCSQKVAGIDTHAYITQSYTKVGIKSKILKVKKTWNDEDDNDGHRPNEISVRLWKDGQDTGKTLLLNSENDWTGEFTRLIGTNPDGSSVVYTVTEDDFEGSQHYNYTTDFSVDQDTGDTLINVINTGILEKINIPVHKTWTDDNDNADNTRPQSITVRLYANGVDTGKRLTIRPNENGEWFGEFTDLNRYYNHGEEIEYSIVEERVSEYVGTVDGYDITNRYYPYGDLIINKEVLDFTDESKNTEFTFSLILTDASGEEVIDKFNYELYDSEGNNVSVGEIGNGDDFHLKNNEKIIIKDIPCRISYEVIEEAKSGFVLTSSSNSTGTIVSGDPIYSTFVNTYQTTGSAQIEAQKILTGRNIVNYQFKFELHDENDEVVSSGYNNASGQVFFGQINYSNEDNGITHRYSVVEVEGSSGGYTYDKTIYYVEVTPHDLGNGTMRCDIVYYDEENNPIDITIDTQHYSIPVFQNEYHAQGTISLRAWKVLNARTLKSSEFTFNLYNEAFELVSSTKNSSDGTLVFPNISYDETDIGNTYWYFAHEVLGSDSTVVYDTKTIAYKIIVIDNGNGTLSFAQSTYDVSDQFSECTICHGVGKVSGVDDEGAETLITCSLCHGMGYVLTAPITEPEEQTTPVFENELKDGGFSVVKVLSGIDESEQVFTFKARLIGDKITEDFEVKYEKTKGDEPIDNGTYSLTNEEFTFTLHGGEKITFTDIPAGTSYQVWEEIPQDWTILQQSNTSGVISPEIITAAQIVNKYDPGVVSVPVVGSKYFDGKAAAYDNKGNSFQFGLYKAEDDSLVQKVNSTAGGFIQFTPLVFEKPGSYDYYIKEINTGNADIVYDTHVESFTIVVTQNSDGTLRAQAQYDEDKIRFVNQLKPGNLEIAKIGNGITDANKNTNFLFKIKLYNQNGAPLDNGSFRWYVKDSETGDVIRPETTENVSLQPMKNTPIASTMNTSLLDNDFGSASTYAFGRVVNSGVSGTVIWEYYSDGTLVWKPQSGDEGTLASSGTTNSNNTMPWDSYKSQITQLEIEGTIHLNPSSGYLFYNWSNIKRLDLKNLDTSAVTTMKSMFSGCVNLEEVDLSNFDTSKVQKMWDMFYDCSKLTSLDLSSFNTEKVDDMDDMFHNCIGLTSLDLSGFKTPSISDMREMFNGCTGLIKLDLSNFTTEKVNYFQYIFQGCSNLIDLNISSWNTQSCTSSSNAVGLFNGCSRLSRINIGSNFFKGYSTILLPTPPSTGAFVGRWIEEERVLLDDAEGYTPSDLRSKWNSIAMPGIYVWEGSKPVSVTFVSENSSGSMPQGQFWHYEDYIIPTNTFTRYGSTFVGWIDEENDIRYDIVDGEATIPADTYEYGETITLKAIWIDWDEDGRAIFYVRHYQQDAYDEERYILSETTQERGYPNTTITVNPQEYDGFLLPESQQVQVPATELLYVNFYYTRTHYTIHFDGNGADSGEMEDVRMAGGVSASLANQFSKRNCVFVEWNTAPDGSGETYSANSPVKNLAEDGQRITLYAQWLSLDDPAEPTMGEIIVSCKAGQTIVITDIAAGTTYEIEEINMPNGWSVTNSSNVKGKISPNITSSASVTNTYKGIGHAILSAHKKLEGGSLSAGQFKFKLFSEHLKRTVSKIAHSSNINDNGDRIDDYENSKTEFQPITIEGASKLHINLTYETESSADYVYIIKGIANSTSSYLQRYSGSRNTISYDVEGDSVTLAFSTDSSVNKYYGYYATVSAEIIDDDFYAYNGSVDEIKDGVDDDTQYENEWYGTAPVNFDMLEFNEPGEYVFYIKEMIEDTDKIIFDEHIEEVHVIVSDNGDGTLSTEVIYDEDGPLFTNKMTTGDLIVHKYLENGTDAAKNIDFTFTISLKDNEGNPLEQSYNATKTDETSIKIKDGDTFTLKADQELTIHDLPHGGQYDIQENTTPGFVLKEKNNDTGVIIGKKTVDAVFTNIYSAQGSIVLKAHKDFAGLPINPQQFQFALVSSMNEILQLAYADENGDVEFAPIDYTEADAGRSYLYRISEVDLQEDNIQYDGHYAFVSVDVNDTGNGVLDVESEVDENDLTFTNVPLFDLEVSKTVTGLDQDRTRDFRFSIMLSNTLYGLPNLLVWEGTSSGGTFSPNDGELVFSVRHGEKFTIKDLPAGTKYYIREEFYDDYATLITREAEGVVDTKQGLIITGDLYADTAINYENVWSVAIPETGGSGEPIFYFAGIAIILSSLVFIRFRRRMDIIC